MTLDGMLVTKNINCCDDLVAMATNFIIMDIDMIFNKMAMSCQIQLKSGKPFPILIVVVKKFLVFNSSLSSLCNKSTIYY